MLTGSAPQPIAQSKPPAHSAVDSSCASNRDRSSHPAFSGPAFPATQPAVTPVTPLRHRRPRTPPAATPSPRCSPSPPHRRAQRAAHPFPRRGPHARPTQLPAHPRPPRRPAPRPQPSTFPISTRVTPSPPLRLQEAHPSLGLPSPLAAAVALMLSPAPPPSVSPNINGPRSHLPSQGTPPSAPPSRVFSRPRCGVYALQAIYARPLLSRPFVRPRCPSSQTRPPARPSRSPGVIYRLFPPLLVPVRQPPTWDSPALFLQSRRLAPRVPSSQRTALVHRRVRWSVRPQFSPHAWWSALT